MIAAVQNQGQLLILPLVFTKSLIRIIKHFISDIFYIPNVRFENEITNFNITPNILTIIFE